MITKPEGKASKGWMDIWVGKTPCREKMKEQVASYSITYSMITKSVPDPFNSGIYTHVQKWSRILPKSETIERVKISKPVGFYACTVKENVQLA